MKLHELSPAGGSKHRRTRLGRGEGSGFGGKSGRGTKGQKSRSGSRGGTRPGFEGGQTPIQRTVPKRGFVNIFATEYACVNVQDLNRFEEGAVVDADSLMEIGLVRKPLDGVKILGSGELEKKLTVKATAFSKAAIEKIEQAGGKAEVI